MIRHLPLDQAMRRRNTVADLRLVAELIEDGLPVPLSIHPKQDGVQVHVRDTDVTAWLAFLNALGTASWQPTLVGEGEHLKVTVTHLGTPITVQAFRLITSEVCS